MRAVLDTNTVVSALLWGGTPNELLAAATEERIELYTSAALVAELTDVLSRMKFAPRLARANRTVATLIAQYTGLAETIVAARINPVVLADPDDDHVLACALAARAELIVSGDAHLLNLKHYQGIPIVSATAALAFIAKP